MWVEQKIKDYQAMLMEGDGEKVSVLFCRDAEVHSPLYGRINAGSFYKKLFKDTQHSSIVLKGIFRNMHNPKQAAALFHYQWTLNNDKTVSFDCVDIFEFDEKSKKIKTLLIVYDSQDARSGWQTVRA